MSAGAEPHNPMDKDKKNLKNRPQYLVNSNIWIGNMEYSR